MVANMNNLQKFLAFSLIALVAIFFRLIPHPPNVTPLVGLSLLAGVIFGANNRLAYILPLSAMFLSDIFLGFHPSMVFVYASVAVIPVFSLFLRKQNLISLLGVSVLSSTVFYIVTNFGHWLMTTMYQKNTSGLLMSYIAGVPFFKMTLTGDILFSLIFVGLYNLANRKIEDINLLRSGSQTTSSRSQ